MSDATTDHEALNSDMMDKMRTKAVLRLAKKGKPHDNDNCYDAIQWRGGNAVHLAMIGAEVWVDSRPGSGSVNEVRELLLRTEAGLRRVPFGDWVMRNPDGTFESKSTYVVWKDFELYNPPEVIKRADED